MNIRHSTNLSIVAVVLAAVCLAALIKARKRAPELPPWMSNSMIAIPAYDQGFMDGSRSAIAHYSTTNKIELAPLLEDMFTGSSNYMQKLAERK